MGKLAFAATIWLAVAGLLGGTVINARAERCGHPQQLTQDDVQSWLWWPVLVVAAITVESNSLAYEACDAPENDHAR